MESFLYFEKSYLKITKTGEVVMNGSRPDFFGGIVVLLVCLIISFIIFFILYGFGDIVENVAMIKQKMCSEADSKDNSTAVNEGEVVNEVEYNEN